MARMIGNQELVRKTNQRSIIELIQQMGLISRADLAKTLELSAPTVSANIDRLLRRDVLLETGSGDSTGGRPPIMLRLNPGYGFIAGVDLSSDCARIALADFSGSLILQSSLAINSGEGEEILKAAIVEIFKLIKESSLDSDRLLSVAVATPGVLDPKTNRLHFVPQFSGWEDFPIAEIMSESFNCPILIKNDINTATLGEIKFGAGKGCQSLTYISVDIGVGAGLVLQGQLFEGTHGAAGEIGHMVIDSKSVLKRRRGLGSLEAIVSVPTILDRASQYVKFMDNNIAGRLKELRMQLESGNQDVIQLVTEIARLTGYMVANIQAILDLEMAVLGGSIKALGDYYLQIVRETVNELTPITLPVVYSSLGELAVLRGAFAVAGEKAIDNLVEEG